jgi:hypothetical protein
MKNGEEKRGGVAVRYKTSKTRGSNQRRSKIFPRARGYSQFPTSHAEYAVCAVPFPLHEGGNLTAP